MKNLKSMADAEPEPQQAKLCGYVNPLKMTPSFLIPLLEADSKLVLQEADEKGKIRRFYPYNEASPDEIMRLPDENVVVEKGGDVLYGFIFPDGQYAIGTRRLLAQRLWDEREKLSEYAFLFTEVVEFVGKERALERAISKVERIYASNERLSKNWVTAERKFLEKKTSPGEIYVTGTAPEQKRGKRTQKVGIVASDRMQKTVVVRVDRLVKHPKYRRYVRRTAKFMAHDEIGATIGDKVRIVETRPLSARKRWRVVEIVQKAQK